MDVDVYLKSDLYKNNAPKYQALYNEFIMLNPPYLQIVILTEKEAEDTSTKIVDEILKFYS